MCVCVCVCAQDIVDETTISVEEDDDLNDVFGSVSPTDFIHTVPLHLPPHTHTHTYTHTHTHTQRWGSCQTPSTKLRILLST